MIVYYKHILNLCFNYLYENKNFDIYIYIYIYIYIAKSSIPNMSVTNTSISNTSNISDFIKNIKDIGFCLIVLCMIVFVCVFIYKIITDSDGSFINKLGTIVGTIVVVIIGLCSLFNFFYM